MSYWGELQTPKLKCQQPHCEGSGPRMSPLQCTPTFKENFLRARPWGYSSEEDSRGSQGPHCPGQWFSSRSAFCLPRDIWQRLETFLVATTWVGHLWHLVGRDQGGSSSPYHAQDSLSPPTIKNDPAKSVPPLRKPGLRSRDGVADKQAN